jgi:hypothetical protein
MPPHSAIQVKRWQICFNNDLCFTIQLIINFRFVIALRYSDWLQAGRPRGRSSIPGKVKNFFFSTSSRSNLGPIQPLIQWVPGALSSEVKRQGRECRGQENVDLYIRPSSRLHGVVLNSLKQGQLYLLLNLPTPFLLAIYKYSGRAV